jgi:hypothetical protein
LCGMQLHLVHLRYVSVCEGAYKCQYAQRELAQLRSRWHITHNMFP